MNIYCNVVSYNLFVFLNPPLVGSRKLQFLYSASLDAPCRIGVFRKMMKSSIRKLQIVFGAFGASYNLFVFLNPPKVGSRKLILIYHSYGWYIIYTITY